MKREIKNHIRKMIKQGLIEEFEIKEYRQLPFGLIDVIVITSVDRDYSKRHNKTKAFKVIREYFKLKSKGRMPKNIRWTIRYIRTHFL